MRKIRRAKYHVLGDGRTSPHVGTGRYLQKDNILNLGNGCNKILLAALLRYLRGTGTVLSYAANLVKEGYADTMREQCKAAVVLMKDHTGPQPWDGPRSSIWQTG
jgi:hypothetical protein